MRNNKAEYEEAATKVWWDIEECPIPRGCKAQEIAQKISSALSKLNYRGPVSISAFGNFNHIPPSIKQALSSTGIALNQVQPRKISLHIMNESAFWAWDNPPPANVMFISFGDTFLDFLQSDGYNFLLAHPPHASASTVASANASWLWRSLLEEPKIISLDSHLTIAAATTGEEEASRTEVEMIEDRNGVEKTKLENPT